VGRGHFRLWFPARSQSESKGSFFLFYGVSLRMRRWAGVAFDFECLHGHKANRKVRFFCFMAFQYGWEGGQGSLSTLNPYTVTKRIERFAFFVFGRHTTDGKVWQGSLPTLNPYTVTKRIERFAFFVFWCFTTDEKVWQGSLSTLNPYTVTKRIERFAFFCFWAFHYGWEG
jgi:hypothetical protein